MRLVKVDELERADFLPISPPGYSFTLLRDGTPCLVFSEEIAGKWVPQIVIKFDSLEDISRFANELGKQTWQREHGEA